MKSRSGEPGPVLVVDDDPDIRQIVAADFEGHGLPTVAAAGRQEALRLLATRGPSLVILDLPAGRPGGLDLLREIRLRSDVPVIITGDPRCDEMDRVVGLELGADDYVLKPLGLQELRARVRAVLRRQKIGHGTSLRKLERGRSRFGGWQIDRRARRLTNPSGACVALTKGEYALLTAFLDAPRRALTREHLLQATRVHEDTVDRSIDVQVLRLRRKLESDAGAPRLIRTERGIGYIFTLPVEPI